MRVWTPGVEIASKVGGGRMVTPLLGWHTAGADRRYGERSSGSCIPGNLFHFGLRPISLCARPNTLSRWTLVWAFHVTRELDEKRERVK
jgi:hypothetical protein